MNLELANSSLAILGAGCVRIVHAASFIKKPAVKWTPFEGQEKARILLPYWVFIEC